MGCNCAGKGVRNVRNGRSSPIVSPRQQSSPGPVLLPKRISEQITAQSTNEGLTTSAREEAKNRRLKILNKLGRL